MKEKIRLLLEANDKDKEKEKPMTLEAMPQTPPSKPEPGREHEPGKHEPGKHEEPGKHAPGRDPSEPQDQPKEEAPASSMVSLSTAQFQALVNELRKPVIDPQAEVRKKRWREHNRKLQQDQRSMIISRFYSCNHMQMPGSVLSGCSVIAWATQTDGVKRGTCQHCGTIFSPKRQECASREIWEAYPMLIRIPTHPGGNYNTIFQSA